MEARGEDMEEARGEDMKEARGEDMKEDTEGDMEEDTEENMEEDTENMEGREAHQAPLCPVLLVIINKATRGSRKRARQQHRT
jgi:hypothetical protein